MSPILLLLIIVVLVVIAAYVAKLLIGIVVSLIIFVFAMFYEGIKWAYKNIKGSE